MQTATAAAILAAQKQSANAYALAAECREKGRPDSLEWAIEFQRHAAEQSERARRLIGL